MSEHSMHQLAERIARIEEELAKIKAQLVEQSRRRFEATAGIHEGSETYQEVIREMRKIREADRRAARANGKGKRSKPRRRSPLNDEAR